MTVTPSGRCVTSIRHRLRATAADRPSATSGRARPSSPASAAAASALVTLCSPNSRSRTRRRALRCDQRERWPAAVIEPDVRRPHRRLAARGRTSPPWPRCAPAMASTRGSSALSSATPSAGRRRGQLALWPAPPPPGRRTRRRVPCRRTARCQTMAARSRTAGRYGPAHARTTRAPGTGWPRVTRRMVSGWPISLLKRAVRRHGGPEPLDQLGRQVLGGGLARPSR